MLPDGIVAQTHAVMANLCLVLTELALGFPHVGMARIYLTDFARDCAAMNDAWRSYFAERRTPNAERRADLRRRHRPRR